MRQMWTVLNPHGPNHLGSARRRAVCGRRCSSPGMARCSRRRCAQPPARPVQHSVPSLPYFSASLVSAIFQLHHHALCPTQCFFTVPSFSASSFSALFQCPSTPCALTQCPLLVPRLQRARERELNRSADVECGWLATDQLLTTQGDRDRRIFHAANADFLQPNGPNHLT